MPDPIPPLPPKPRKRGAVNRETLAALATATRVAKSARNTKYAPGLDEVEMDPALPAQADTLVRRISIALGLIKGARAGRRVMSKQERDARDAVLAALGPIQSAARRKYTGADADTRGVYAIGEDLSNAGLDAVLTAARAVLDRLAPGPKNAPPADTLPGIKADGAIKTLNDAVTLYTGKDEAQGEQQTTAEEGLEDVEAALLDLAALRRQIQLAADQRWPWHAEKVGSIRKAFALPRDRPLTD